MKLSRAVVASSLLILSCISCAANPPASPNQLPPSVAAGKAQRATEAEALRNFHFAVRSEEQRQLPDGQWEAWGPRMHLNAWLEKVDGGSFRVDFVPQISVWSDGAAPLSETRYVKAWDGQRYVKVDYLYGGEPRGYKPRISEDRSDVPEYEAGPDVIWNVIASFLVGKDDHFGTPIENVLAMAKLDGDSVTVSQDADHVVIDFAKPEQPELVRLRYTFSREHQLRLVRIEHPQLDPDAGPSSTFEILEWRRIDGLRYAIPSAWTRRSYCPESFGGGPCRTYFTLDRFARFDADEQAKAFSIADIPLGEQTESPVERTGFRYLNVAE